MARALLAAAHDGGKTIDVESAGVQDVFAQRTRQFLPQLYRVARRLTAQSADAEDLVHDTYVKAFYAFDGKALASAEDCRAWLTRILINTYRDQYRRRLRSPVITLSAPENDRPDPIALAASPAPGPAAEVEARRFAEAAQAAILDLPPELRLIMALFLIEGLSYEQIAARMKVPVGTVMSRLWRARRTLRRQLHGYLAPDDAKARPERGCRQPGARRAQS